MAETGQQLRGLAKVGCLDRRIEGCNCWQQRVYAFPVAGAEGKRPAGWQLSKWQNAGAVFTGAAEVVTCLIRRRMGADKIPVDFDSQSWGVADRCQRTFNGQGIDRNGVAMVGGAERVTGVFFDLQVRAGYD